LSSYNKHPRTIAPTRPKTTKTEIRLDQRNSNHPSLLRPCRERGEDKSPGDIIQGRRSIIACTTGACHSSPRPSLPSHHTSRKGTRGDRRKAREMDGARRDGGKMRDPRGVKGDRSSVFLFVSSRA